MAIDWTDWILEKNAKAEEESLKKSDFVEVESLEKAAIELPFEHGSHIKIVRGITNKDTGETHGYEVHETKANGDKVIHPNIKYSHMDSKMDNGRLRMGAENATKKHDLYTEAKVRRATRRNTNGKVKSIVELHPHGEPHTLKSA